jgi:hypothetical protein
MGISKEVDIREHERWAERQSRYDGSLGRNTLRRVFHGQPITLRWQGWQTSTHTLEREGWQILAEEHQDLYSDRHVVRLGCHSPDKRALISGQFALHMGEILNHGSQYMEMLFQHGFDMQSYSFRDTYATLDPVDFKSLNSLNPVNIHAPVDLSTRTLDYRKIRCFEYIEDTGKEIFIKPSSVDGCLNMILKIQHPEQQQLKKSLILPEKKPIIQAKIFSLAV